MCQLCISGSAACDAENLQRLPAEVATCFLVPKPSQHLLVSGGQHMTITCVRKSCSCAKPQYMQNPNTYYAIRCQSTVLLLLLLQLLLLFSAAAAAASAIHELCYSRPHS